MFLKNLSAASTRKGQSLVEMAITAPILIFMLIGVLEVGWVLRGYLVLVNVNREITRYAVRPGYMDFSTKADVITSYLRVQERALETLGGQLNMEVDASGTLTGNTTLIISHVVVDTGLPCEDIQTNPGNCDCDKFMSDPNYNPFPWDDLILHPDRPGMEYQRMVFGPAETVTGPRITRVNINDILYNDNDRNGSVDDQDGLVPRNNMFNCELMKKGGVASANNVIVTELFFDQPQLFGFPLISNPYTDPLPLYTHTTMRLVGGARSTGQEGGDLTAGIDTIGPICNAMPFAVRDTTVADTDIGTKMDILDGAGGNHYGWLAWNPSKTGIDDLKRQLKYSATSVNEYYEDAVEAGDHILSLGDSIASLPYKLETVESTDKLLTGLVGRKMRVPVWNSFTSNNYHITNFVWVQIDSSSDIQLSDANPKVMATYLGNAAEECPPN
ncbi:MAG: pilus assembly protein [Anaerolineae bacterium]|nr:pilus assembly protein [Anaerolineae bacterium]